LEHECINFEGLDQVGKGDAVKNLSLEISELGYDTSVISFPYYATPLGFCIRDILVNGVPDDIEMDRSREVEVKMCLFALNRLEILNCILCDKKHDVYVFDRGPFSCALTIGYHIFQNKEDIDKKEEFVDKGLYLDSYFREVLNVDNCVIYLKHRDIRWEKSRDKEVSDLYERSEVQDISANIYSIFSKKIGNGWRDVVTKNEKGWRSREDIKNECLDISRERGVLNDLGKKSNNGRQSYLGIDEIQKFLYKGSRVDDSLINDWMAAIQCNDKKEVYRVSELISDSLVKATRVINWYDCNIINEVKNLISEFPEILDIIDHKYGKVFLDKFKDSLSD